MKFNDILRKNSRSDSGDSQKNTINISHLDHDSVTGISLQPPLEPNDKFDDKEENEQQCQIDKVRKQALDEMHFVLSEDFYALTFMSYKKENVELYKLTSKQQARYFQSCLWVFGVQLILLYLICDEMLFQPIKDGRLTFHVPDVSTLFGQFFACVLLHMELVGEVR